MKYFLDQKGVVRDVAYLTASSISDLPGDLLADVMMEVRVAADGSPTVAFMAENSEFVAQFNEPRLVALALEAVKQILAAEEWDSLYSLPNTWLNYRVAAMLDNPTITPAASQALIARSMERPERSRRGHAHRCPNSL